MGRVLLTLALVGCASAPAPPAPPAGPTSRIEPARVIVSRTPQDVAARPPEGVPHAVVVRRNYRIEFGPYALEADPTDGGRIVRFSLDGRSVVVPREESPEAYGSSFWPSPQSDWQWPPPLELDRAAWTATVEGTSLILESGTNKKLGLSAKRRITAEPKRGAILIELSLANRGSAPRRVAPWQNTRVRPKGITFFPSSGPALEESSLKLEPAEGIVWFSHDPAAFTES